MLCSISNGKSGSNWLDRLRSTKGFPVGNGLDLEHFLNSNPSLSISSETKVSDTETEKYNLKSISDSAPSDAKPIADRKRTMENTGVQKNRQKDDWFDIMSTVLAELFNMGDSSEFHREKKSSRKQRNPKICVFSASASVDNSSLDGVVRRVEGVPAMSPPSADNSVTEVERTGGRSKQKKKRASIAVEGKSQADRSAYSRAEVTIIDTSSPLWKFEKLLCRKGNVWKVRDKKWKSKNVSVFKKKRKLSQSDREVGGKRKRKTSPQPSSTSKEAGPEERIISSKEVRFFVTFAAYDYSQQQ
ncbi:hypothetical protein HHK36_000005 [Tetracentron sinense]|uniref:Uncharacterized protein n=1 Tax=Tetracentron sinense TaxID=13715 RepID=A0A835DTM0_TETSI|nr:hypothetical protein HHK36_000005 [Tetracentron sinense]